MVRPVGCAATVIIAVGLGLWLLLRAPTVDKSVDRKQDAIASAFGARIALQLYQRQHKVLQFLPPPGSNAAVYVSGPRQNVELSPLRPEQVSSAGELLDPWKHPFVFQVVGNSFTVLSSGPDGRLATADDISSED